MKEVKRRKSSGGHSIPGFKAWSFSRLRDWEKCPRYAKHRHLDKLDEGPKGPALLRGGEIHKQAEAYLKGEVRKLPDTLRYFEAEFKDLRKSKAVAEGPLALDASLNPVDWYAPQAWVRVILDACVLRSRYVQVVDFKTGRIYPEHEDQLSLYALCALSAYPKVEKVETELWYLDSGDMRSSEYKLSDVPALLSYWQQRSEGLLSDSSYAPTPSAGACRWCAFKKSKGGPCGDEYQGG